MSGKKRLSSFMVKKLRAFLFVIIFALPTAAAAQFVALLDIESKQGIPYVLVYNSDSTISTQSDKNGKCDLTNFNMTDDIIFRHSAYDTKTISKRDLIEIGYKIYLQPSIEELDEVSVSASFFETEMRESGKPMELIDSKTIELSNASTTADLLMEQGGVSVQKSQGGGGSPIIRSFEANKILLVIDGVRMNNAIYRSGHLQNSITLDKAILGKTEIVYGPGSVNYGSDALGGVIHFYTKNPMLSDGKQSFNANASSSISTANIGRSGHIDFNVGFERVAFLSSVSFNRFGHIRQGKNRSAKIGNLGKREFYVEPIFGVDSILSNPDPELQIGTSYSQIDLLQKVIFSNGNNNRHLLNLQYSTSSDIDRYDRLTLVSDGLPRFAEWYYGPQKRFLASYDFFHQAKRKIYNSSKTIISYQNIQESRINRIYRSSIRNHQEEFLNILGIHQAFEKTSLKNTLSYGGDIYQNWVNSSAYNFNIENNSTSEAISRYPDETNSQLTAGLYLSNQYKLSEKIHLLGGLRYTYVNLISSSKNTVQFPFLAEGISLQNAALNGYAGINYLIGESSNIAFRYSRGFRAPNLDDVAKVFESIPGTVTIPNNDLKPEHLDNIDLSASLNISAQLQLNGAVYYNWISNLISRQAAQYLGQDSILFFGEKSQVLQNTNANSAQAYGANAGINFYPIKNLKIYSRVSLQRGRINTDTTDYPLDHVPPLYGRSGIEFSHEKYLISFFSLYNGAKRKEDYNILGSDKFNQANPDGLPAWYTLNFKADYFINDQIELGFAVENILDQNYRTFASGVSAAGINYRFSLRMRY